MPDSKELFQKLKNLNSSQFDRVLFQLEIDRTLIRENDTQTQKAIQVIDLLKQQHDGLTQLENILKDLKYSLKVSRGLWSLLPLLVVVLLGLFISKNWQPQASDQPTPSTSNNNSSTAPQPSDQPIPSTSNDNSYPCSEGYKFRGSGPGPSGEYSGWCEPTPSNAGAEQYQCVGKPNTLMCRKP